MILSREHLKQIIDHSYAAFPYEGCGLAGGKDNVVSVIIPVPNASLTPLNAFEMERQAMVDAVVGLQRADLDVVAIYHSHPHGRAIPSERDIAEATWPDAVYLIVGLVEGEDPEVRGWHIRYDQAVETELVVAD